MRIACALKQITSKRFTYSFFFFEAVVQENVWICFILCCWISHICILRMAFVVDCLLAYFKY